MLAYVPKRKKMIIIIVSLTVFFYRENKVFACPYKHLRLTV